MLSLQDRITNQAKIGSPRRCRKNSNAKVELGMTARTQDGGQDESWNGGPETIKETMAPTI